MTDPADSQPDSPRTRRRRAVVMALLGAAVLVGGAGAVVWRWRGAPGTQATGAENRVVALPVIDMAGFDDAVVEVIDKARAAVVASPASAQAWGQLGMLLRAHNLPAPSNVCLAEAERLDPADGRWPYYQGLSLAAGDPDAAIVKFQRACELLGDEPVAARLRLAETLWRQGRAADAEAAFQRVLAHDATNPRAHLGMARVALRRNELSAGMEHARVSAADPRTAKGALILLAQLYQLRGESDAAARAAGRAAALPDDPPWPDPLIKAFVSLRRGAQSRIEMADVLLDQHRLDEAAAFLAQAVHDYPDSDWLWLLLGKTRLLQNDAQRARTALLQAARLAPRSAEIQFHLGFALARLNQYDQAADRFGKVLEVKPDAQASYLLGHCLLQQGDADGAIEAFQAAVDLQPSMAKAHAALGELLAKRGRAVEAAEHLKAAVQLDPDDAAVRQRLDQVLGQIGPGSDPSPRPRPGQEPARPGD